MDNPNLFKALQPKDSQLINQQSLNEYRPRSTQQKRRVQRYIDPDSEAKRPPSQQSSQTRSSKRIIYISRNGKKKEPLDEDYIPPRNITLHTKTGWVGLPPNRKITTQQSNKALEDVSTPIEQPLRTEQVETPVDDGSSNLVPCASEIDPFILDSISINDPIWNQIVPDTLVDQIDMAKLIEDNPEYFHHHLGFCACYRCKCGRCRCDVSSTVKLRVNGSLLSVYGKDFVSKSQTELNKIHQINHLNYQTQFLNQQTIDFRSTKQNDFNFKKPFKHERINKEQAYHGGSMTNLTSYRQTFSNWGQQDFKIVKRIQHISTSNDIPFLGKSTYQDNFNQNDKQKPELPAFQNSHLSPLPSGPFFGQTTSQKAFAPFKINTAKSPSYVQERLPTHTPIFEGQFKTSGMRDYRGASEDYCPAPQYKKAWKLKLIQKYNQIRDQRMNEMIK